MTTTFSSKNISGCVFVYSEEVALVVGFFVFFFLVLGFAFHFLINELLSNLKRKHFSPTIKVIVA